MQRAASFPARPFVHAAALVVVVLGAACVDSTAQGGAGNATFAGSGGYGGWGGYGGSGGYGGVGDTCVPGSVSTPQWRLSVTPRHFTTNVAAEAMIWLRGPVSHTSLPAAAMDALEQATLVRVVDGVTIESVVTLDVIPYCNREATVQLTVAPTQALDEGWYQFVVDGSFEGTSRPFDMPEVAPNRYVSAFRVGSAPFVTKVADLSPDAAANVEMSEPVVMPSLVPIAKATAGSPGTACARNVPPDATPIASVYLLCSETSPEARDYVFGEGIVSPSGVPLRNIAGDTSFRITVPFIDPQGLSGRTWTAAEIPTF